MARSGGGERNAATGEHATVGGGRYNLVAADFGTIAGGGPWDFGNPATSNNRVYDKYGTIGGGGGNVAGFDDGDAALQPYATISGGEHSTASGGHATVGGGSYNTAAAFAATAGGGEGNSATGTGTVVAGGQSNRAVGRLSTVSGGSSNVVSATFGTVGGGTGNQITAGYGIIPGGVQNYVGGALGFAAGYHARAEHQGSFVWSDATGPFTTTAPNQFLIDADGGVGIGTNAPSHMLTVEGSAVLLSSDVLSVSVIDSLPSMLEAPNAVLCCRGYALRHVVLDEYPVAVECVEPGSGCARGSHHQQPHEAQRPIRLGAASLRHVRVEQSPRGFRSIKSSRAGLAGVHGPGSGQSRCPLCGG